MLFSFSVWGGPRCMRAPAGEKGKRNAFNAADQTPQSAGSRRNTENLWVSRFGDPEYCALRSEQHAS